MTTHDTSGPRGEHSPEEATRWFNQWHVYRSIVDANWMAHREIFTAVEAWVLVRHPGPFVLLDLGCGDAGFIRRTFDETGLWAYTGVDASTAAIEKARQELVGARFHAELVETDMLAFLATIGDSGAPVCDIALASYAVHHLPVAEKQRFFRLAHAAIRPGGSLLYGDIFRRDGETRDHYVESYVGMMRGTWTGMPPESLASTIEHITQRDFPETGGDVCEMAREAGFREGVRELFRDATGFHRLLAFPRPPGSGWPGATPGTKYST